MPLIKSAKPKAVGENIKTEMEAGKPHNQSIAIALSVQRRAKKRKMAEGGPVPSPSPMLEPIKKELYDDEDYKDSEAREAEQPKSRKGEMEIEEEPEMKAFGGIAGDLETNHLRDDEEDLMGMDAPMSPETEPSSFYDEIDEEQTSASEPSNDSIADRIMRKRMAYGGSVDENDQEDPQTPYDPMNAKAYSHKLYDVDQLSAQPEDSNEHGDDITSDVMDHIEIIRKKLKAKRGE